MPYIESASYQSLFDSDTGYDTYLRMIASLNDSELESQSFTPGELLLVQKKKTYTTQNIPIEMQMELALLWRTLGILRYSMRAPGVMQSFFEDLLCVIEGVDSLSLANFYDCSDQNSHVKILQDEYVVFLLSIVAKSLNPKHSLLLPTSAETDSSTEKGTDCHFLFSVPELAYLNEGSDFPKEDANDSFGIVQKLFNSAENFALSLPSVERNAMYSVCLALAVKSGRLSLLLQTACLLSSNNTQKNNEFTFSSHIVLKDLISCIRTSSSKLEMIKISAKKNKFQQLSHLQRRKESLSQKHEDSNFESVYPFFHRKCHRSMKNITLSFGKADHGKLGLGDTQLHRLVPTIIESLKDINITKISSMGTTTVCIDLGGSAYMWGVGGSAGSNSQAWNTSTYGYSLHDHQINAHPRRIESLPFDSFVVDISCGLGHVLFLMQTGQVYSSGSGGNGRLGLGDVGDRKEPCLVMLEGFFCCYCCYYYCRIIQTSIVDITSTLLYVPYYDYQYS
jgi:hypothetical protein